ncbi:DUF309 domain-containing protein [Priestia koreensis]|uniref:DUF309 domain-containing protein n=1 Tax=Priestia koreensis TaxID=284581 RepID=UPI003457E100
MYPRAYIDYLVHFHGDRDYFECHEILEEFWKEKEAKHRDQFWVGFIQIAVSLYHQRRQNFNGSFRMMKGAIRILSTHESMLSTLGLDGETLLRILTKRLEEISAHQAYRSLYLPIVDQGLLQHCEARSRELNMGWWKDSDLKLEAITHRHSLRDRSDVVAARKESLEKKQSHR